MTNATRHKRRAGSTGRSAPVRVVSRTGAGVAVVAAAAPEHSPTGPVTNATWVASRVNDRRDFCDARALGLVA